MPKFNIRMLVEGEVEAENLHAAIDWCKEHTVFDLLDLGAGVSGEAIHDPETQDLLADLDGIHKEIAKPSPSLLSPIQQEGVDRLLKLCEEAETAEDDGTPLTATEVASIIGYAVAEIREKVGDNEHTPSSHEIAGRDPETFLRGRDKNEALLQHYQMLHDGLSEMVEGGLLDRLKRAEPDDYAWLVSMLEVAAIIGEKRLTSEPLPHNGGGLRDLRGPAR